MQKLATIVHLDGIANVTPLVGGYLKAFALADPAVRSEWRIELLSRHCQIKASTVLLELVRRQPDLVAFSVYTWNSGLVRRLLPALRGLLPSTRFLLGGVEVVDVAPRFVEPHWENVLVCNGEGERTFRDLLLELSQARPDFAKVGGITFSSAGAFITNPGQPRIQDLTELPSPWLTGAFDDLGKLDVALFETNRGCPFACEFCFWGGAIGQKIYQQDLERLREELTWIAKRGIRALSICDANFGILPRDVALAEHLVALRRLHGGPMRVIYNSSKVRPERVEQISSIFAEAEMMSRHVFSMQSMSPAVLEIARRTSLEREPYREIQRRLNAKGQASLVELLWPMPGETLESFQAGVGDLLGLGAQGFLVYPLIWLNSTGYSGHTAEYGVITLPEDDAAGGGQLVVSTREVGFEAYLEGLRFTLALFLLHDCRGLYATLQLLNTCGVASFQTVLADFAGWMGTEARGQIAELWRARMACFEDMAKYTWRGMLANAVLNDQRLAFDQLLVDYVAQRAAWFEGPHGELLRSAAEYDLLTRPYIFLQTKCELEVELRQFTRLPSRSRLWNVHSAYNFPRLISELRSGNPLRLEDLEPGQYSLSIDHRTHQLFLLPGRAPEELYWLCTSAVQEVARIEPRSMVVTASELEAPAPAGV